MKISIIKTFVILAAVFVIHGCGSGFNDLPDPPVVTTQSATGTTPKSSTLNGSVIPNEDATKAWFEWGVDESYDNISEEFVLGSSTETIPVVYGISALTPNKQYYYRLVAQNSSDTIYGEGMTFTTPAIPLPTLAPIRSATESQSINCTLMGITANPNGYDTQAWFEYGLGTTYGSVTTPGNLGAGAIDIDFSQAIPNYDLSTIYHYRALAQNEGGIVTGEDSLCTTPAATGVIPPTDPPTATTLTATTITPVSVTLNGEGNPLGTDSVGWFQWGTTTNYDNQTLEQSLGNGTSTQPYTQDISGLQPDTDYHYRSVARGYGNIAIYGTDQIFHSALMVNAVTNAAINVAQKTFTMNAIINPNGFSASAWFEWGVTSSYGETTAERVIGNGVNPQLFFESLPGLLQNTTYHYRVVAKGYNDIIVRGQDETVTTLIVPPPGVVTLNPSLVTETSCAFGGTANPNGFDTEGWIEWGTTATYGAITSPVSLGNGTVAMPVTAVINNLAPNTTYHYRAAARNEGGTTFGNDEICTTQDNALRISNIAVTDITTTSAVISWDTTLVASSRVDYDLTSNYRFNVTDTATKTTHQLTINNLAPFTLYHFKITSVDQANNAVESGDATFTTQDAPLTSINVAQGKTGIASSTNSGYSTSAPLDGVRDQTAVTNLMWSPATANADEWYTVDLQALYTIDQVRLTMGSNTTAYTTTRGFTIDTSADGAIWTTQATVNNNTEFTKTITFAPIEARYVRFTISQGSALNGLSYLIELEVYQAFFVTTGTYTSAVHDMGQARDFTTLTWTEALNGQTITIKARTCDDPICVGEPDFATLTNITNGGALSDGGGAIDGHRYVQYQAILATADIYKTPSLNSITINTTNNSWVQTDDSATDTGFNQEGHSKTYTQVTNQNGGNIQLSKPPLGGTGQDGAYLCLTGTCTNLPGGVYNFTSFYIAQGAIVDVPKGGPALVIYSQRDVTIDGALKVNGEQSDVIGFSAISPLGGAGGAKGGVGGFRPGPDQGIAENGYGAGGGYANFYSSGSGGGFGGIGGTGYDGGEGQGVSIGGISYGNALNGGSGGAGGWATGNYVIQSGGSGGGGGGAVRISTKGNLSIGPSGLIQANGGNGGSVENIAFKGGGGSGGGIQLEGNTITNNGIIETKGGSSIYGLGSGGGGGGGRIALYDYDGIISGTGLLNLDGGTGYTSGGQGTINIYVYKP